MKELEILRDYKHEIESISFSYQNVLRLIHLIYQTKDLLENNAPIPNKEIALHQAKKLISNDVINIIYCKTVDEIKLAYTELLKAYAIVLNYFN